MNVSLEMSDLKMDTNSHCCLCRCLHNSNFVASVHILFFSRVIKRQMHRVQVLALLCQYSTAASNVSSACFQKTNQDNKSSLSKLEKEQTGHQKTKVLYSKAIN